MFEILMIKFMQKKQIIIIKKKYFNYSYINLIFIFTLKNFILIKIILIIILLYTGKQI